MRALARDARVVGIEFAGDFLAFQRFLAVKLERPNFRVLQGFEALLRLERAPGRRRFRSRRVKRRAAPLRGPVARGARGDAPAAAPLQDQATSLARLYEQGHWLPALKAACAHVGLGNARPPAADHGRRHNASQHRGPRDHARRPA